LVATLNFGLAAAQGRYLARLDADDIAMPQRLEKQVAWMEARPEMVISGSMVEVVDEQAVSQVVARMPENDTEIRWHALFHSPFAHSSVIFRLETLRQHGLRYQPAALHVEDYDLWSRLLEHGRGANLDLPLVRYRLHSQQVSRVGKPEQWANATWVAQRNLVKLGLELPFEQVSTLRRWYYKFPEAFGPEDGALCQALLQILQAFSALPDLDARQRGWIRGRWLLKVIFTPCIRNVACPWKRRLWYYVHPGDLWAVPDYLFHRRQLLKVQDRYLV
jgi:hypothetical protein